MPGEGSYTVVQTIKFEDEVYDKGNLHEIEHGDFYIEFAVFVSFSLVNYMGVPIWKFYGFRTTVDGEGGPVKNKQGIGFRRA